MGGGKREKGREIDHNFVQHNIILLTVKADPVASEDPGGCYGDGEGNGYQYRVKKFPR